MSTATATKERPILFSGEMVRAIIEGRKTQTRRVIKPQPSCSTLGYMVTYEQDGCIQCGEDYPDDDSDFRPSPYGKPGDRLWVRETFTTAGGNRILYYATDDVNGLRKKRPAIHMPRSYSRINLEVTKLRVEQIQRIPVRDIIAEGVSLGTVTQDFTDKYTPAFRELWDRINAKRGFSWQSNPWVWVVEFRRLA